MTSNSDLLVRALRLNAVFSAVSAIAMFLAGNWVADQLGLASVAPVYITATILFLFALRLASIVRSRQLDARKIAAFIAGDVAWVVATIVLVSLFYDSMTVVGFVMVDVVAVVVLLFAVLQFWGLREFQRTAHHK